MKKKQILLISLFLIIALKSFSDIPRNYNPLVRTFLCKDRTYRMKDLRFFLDPSVFFNNETIKFNIAALSPYADSPYAPKEYSNSINRADGVNLIIIPTNSTETSPLTAATETGFFISLCDADNRLISSMIVEATYEFSKCKRGRLKDIADERGDRLKAYMMRVIITDFGSDNHDFYILNQRMSDFEDTDEIPPIATFKIGCHNSDYTPMYANNDACSIWDDSLCPICQPPRARPKARPREKIEAAAVDMRKLADGDMFLARLKGSVVALPVEGSPARAPSMPSHSAVSPPPEFLSPKIRYSGTEKENVHRVATAGSAIMSPSAARQRGRAPVHATPRSTKGKKRTDALKTRGESAPPPIALFSPRAAEARQRHKDRIMGTPTRPPGTGRREDHISHHLEYRTPTRRAEDRTSRMMHGIEASRQPTHKGSVATNPSFI
jgi:hypothetical protein